VSPGQRARAMELLKPIDFIELVAVLGGIKPAMRTQCTGSRVPALVSLARELGLAALESTFAIRPGIVRAGTEFTYSVDAAGRSAPERPRFIYVGADVMAAKIAATFELIDPQRTGAIMGYPPCCVDFFCREFVKDHFDLFPDIAPPLSGTYSPLLNVVAQPFGYTFLSHFPCRWDCTASRNMAQAIFDALRREAPELADEALQCLEADMVYSTDLVIALKSTVWLGENLTIRTGRFHAASAFEGDALRFVGLGAVEVCCRGRVVRVIPKACCLPFRSGTVETFFAGRGSGAGSGA
jgi:hypothetical protein